MDRFLVEGGKPLRGTVRVSGSKNAALPILIATLLTEEECVLHNIPDLRDIRTTLKLIDHLGKRIERHGSTVRVGGRNRVRTRAPYELVKQMRASVLVAGPLLARHHHVQVALPGGCTIGLRPVDIHLAAFSRLGARVSTEHGDVVLRAARLRPASVSFEFPSVGATENLMMAASLLPGRTTIQNAAREPEIEDLADFLSKMGASIRGAGSRTVRIEGSRVLRGAEHTVIPDRVEAGTFLIAAAAAGGRLLLEGAREKDLSALLAALKRSGARVRLLPGGIEIESSGRPRPVSIETRPHPGFPTDLQAPWMAYMAIAQGRSRVREKIFEKRFMHAAELRRMGADIAIDGESAEIRGVPKLLGAPIMASDIRAGAALVVAALAASGKSEIQRVYHIDRGYERIENKLRAVGAEIRRLRH